MHYKIVNSQNNYLKCTKFRWAPSHKVAILVNDKIKHDSIGKHDFECTVQTKFCNKEKCNISNQSIKVGLSNDTKINKIIEIFLIDNWHQIDCCMDHPRHGHNILECLYLTNYKSYDNLKGTDWNRKKNNIKYFFLWNSRQKYRLMKNRKKWHNFVFCLPYYLWWNTLILAIY